MKKGKYFLVFGVLLSLVIGLYSFSNQPPTGMTGAPGETLCTDCHGSTVNDGVGTMELSSSGGVFYESNQTYQMTLSMQRPSAYIYGFSICAIDEQHIQAGSMVVTDSAATHLENFTRQYLSHKDAEDSVNMSFDGALRQFDWVAPDTATGPVTFYYISRMVQHQPVYDDGFYQDPLIIYPVGTDGVDTKITEQQSRFFNFYPNPVARGQSIHLYLDEETSYCIYDVSGKKLMQGDLSAGINKVPTDELTNGVYFIKNLSSDELIKFIVH